MKSFPIVRMPNPTTGYSAFSMTHESTRKFPKHTSGAALILFVAIAIAADTVFAIDPSRQQLHHVGRSCFVRSRCIHVRIGGGSSSLKSVCRRPRLHYAQPESNARENEIGTGASNRLAEIEKEFFVSDAQFVHLGPAARILTEEFYSQRTNFITFQIERLKTVLSLESTFPNRQNSINEQYSRRPLQQMIVACNAKNGQVIGFAEVDARPLGSSQSGGSTNSTSPTDDKSKDILRSYMYNLAVDQKWKRKGIASELVRACEDFVLNMHTSCIEKKLYLRVRKTNHAAVALYEKMGYKEMNPETIELSKEDINSGSLEDGELILFARDLPIPAECLLD